MAKRLLASAFTALALLAGLLFGPVVALAEPSSLVITQQPEDVEVEYPGGASFHVEVSDPEQVESYQWIISDGYSDFVLTGISATTDTLVIPATEQDDPDLFARCVITDKDGNTVESEPGRIHLTNKDEDKTVLFVGDYAVQPGETLDLADTTMGSGTISFDENGADVTFDNVRFSNEVMTYDTQISPGFGIFFMRRNGEVDEYRFTFVGDNVFQDTFFDPEWNSGGIVFNIYTGTGEDPASPTFVFQGDGTLTLEGGSNSIYSDSTVLIDMALVTKPDADHFCDSITARNIVIGEGAQLTLDANGTALRSWGDITMGEGATVAITSSAPHVSVGATAKSVINADGSITLNGATVSIDGFADPERFLPYDTILGNFCGISFMGNLTMNESTVTITMAEKQVDEPFVMSCYGISGEGEDSSIALSGGSLIEVGIDMPDIIVAGGITITGSLDVAEGCNVASSVTAGEEALGVAADAAITMTDATLDSTVASNGEGGAYGVVCGGLSLTLDKPDTYLHSTAEDGIALAVDTGEHGEFDVVPEEGYEPQVISISDGAVIKTPAEHEINLCGAPGYGETVKAETIYDTSDMTKPATEVRIVSSGSSGWAPSGKLIAGSVIAVVAVGAVAFFAGHRKGKGAA